MNYYRVNLGVFKLTYIELFSDLLRLILPKLLIDYFDLVKYYKKTLHLYFKEKNGIPSQKNIKILIVYGGKKGAIMPFSLEQR